ncbi:MAG: sigma-54-dependent transcriptional regulator [Cyclobacteriaceae bacterium]
MKKFAAHILIVDDDEHVTFTSQLILKEYFEHVSTLDSPKTLESLLIQNDYNVILLDMNFRAGITSGNEGLFWMNRIGEISPQTQVVLQTAYGDIELAVRSIKEGAVDFLAKPWDKEKLVTTMINAFQQSVARKQHRELREKQKAFQHHINQNHPAFIASSPKMATVLENIRMVASTDANVLITGENGTGKELVARNIHLQSKRADEAFIQVDLGTIPAALFESELFGHEKGAFTDAKEQRIGKFELANNGTLFLDEIGNLTPELQAKLLTVLQNRTITRIGSNQSISLDFRIVAATNIMLDEAVKSGLFRQDLLYRINTVEIRIPPLRDRKEDIPLLLTHYLDEFSKRYHKPVEPSPNLVDQLSNYGWPGNVRELRHAAERAVILSKSPVISIHDFQLIPDAQHNIKGDSLNLSVVEKNAIHHALMKHNGNLTNAAEELGIARTTLYRKIDEYGLSNS